MKRVSSLRMQTQIEGCSTFQFCHDLSVYVRGKNVEFYNIPLSIVFQRKSGDKITSTKLGIGITVFVQEMGVSVSSVKTRRQRRNNLQATTAPTGQRAAGSRSIIRDAHLSRILS
jgi:hypothetical protein